MKYFFDKMLRVPYDITKSELNKIEDYEFEVDLHGLTYSVALKAMQDIIRYSPKHTENIYVIHGYKEGTALKEMITKPNMKSSRIRRIRPSMNPGQTVIVFKSIE